MRILTRLWIRLDWRARTFHRQRSTSSSACRNLTSSQNLGRKVGTSSVHKRLSLYLFLYVSNGMHCAGSLFFFCYVILIELTSFKGRRVVAFRKNLIEMAELEIKHAKVSSTIEPTAAWSCYLLMKCGGFNTNEELSFNYLQGHPLYVYSRWSKIISYHYVAMMLWISPICTCTQLQQ